MIPAVIRKGSDDDDIVDVPFGDFFKNRRVFMGLIAQIISGCTICFYDPILTLRMEDIGIKHDNAGLPFIALAGAFAFAAPFMGCLADAIDRRIMIQLSFVGLAIGLFLSGGLSNDSVGVTIGGLIMSGVCIGANIVPMIPEILGVMNEDLKRK